MDAVMNEAQVKVLLFGPMAQRAGRREVAVRVPAEGTTCAQLRRRLSEDEPALRELLPACRFAVNQAFVGEDAPVRATDEVALIGMVCGG